MQTKNVKYYSLFIIILVMSMVGHGKAQSVTTYGHADNVFLDDYQFAFDSIVPRVITDTLTGHSYPVSYSDKNGNLKLFTSENYIWNGNYQLINQTNPLNKTLPIIAIPMPGNPDLIYIFSGKRNINQPHLFDTIYYSLIDLKANNGQGKLIAKEQVFDTTKITWGSVCATKHANGQDYWLIVNEWGSRKYFSYRLKPGGNFDTTNSQVGLSYVKSSTYQDAAVMQISPNGRVVADCVTNKDSLQLLRFDAATGQCSDTNIRYIVNYGYSLEPYKCAFSPDNSKIYVFHYEWFLRFCQYDLSTQGQQALLNSRTTLIATTQNLGDQRGSISLTANHKIYNPTGNYWFNTIEKPNLADTNCAWQPYGFQVDSVYGTEPDQPFPKFVSSWLQEPVDISYTHTCLGNDVGGVTHFSFTDSVYKATWHFGDTVTAGPDTSSQLYPSHQYLAPGKYTVWAKALHYGMWDSVSKTITIHQNPLISLGPDTMITPNDTLVLDPGPGYADYKWNFGDTTQTYTVYGSQLNPGVSYHYSVDVTDTNGCSGKAGIDVYCSGVGLEEKAKDQWKVYPNPTENRLTIELPQALHKETHLKLYGPNGALLRQYTWPEQSQTHQISLTGLSEGVYGLELETEDYTLKKKVVKR